MGAKGRPCAPEAAEAVCRARDTWLFVAAVVSAAAVLAVMAWPMVHGRLYTMNDLAHYHLPMRAYYAKCLAEGLDFNWIPNIHCGYYLQGDGQVGMYHPLHRLLYSHLSLTAAFNIELFLSYPLMLGGMYFFLRRWKLGRGASAFGALAFAFSGFNLMHFMHMQAVAIVAHIPWFLFAADAALRGGRRTAIAANLAVALIVASAALLGYPQYLWFMLVTGALYALLVVTLWTRASRGGWLASAVVAGLLIGAVQIMPTYDLLAARRPGAKVHSPFSVMLAPANLVQLVAPFLFEGRVVSTEKSVMTQERALYDGAGVLVLFLLTASGALRAGDKRRLAVGACVLTALGFLLAMGRDGVLYRYVAESAIGRGLSGPGAVCTIRAPRDGGSRRGCARRDSRVAGVVEEADDRRARGSPVRGRCRRAGGGLARAGSREVVADACGPRREGFPPCRGRSDTRGVGGTFGVRGHARHALGASCPGGLRRGRPGVLRPLLYQDETCADAR